MQIKSTSRKANHTTTKQYIIKCTDYTNCSDSPMTQKQQLALACRKGILQCVKR